MSRAVSIESSSNFPIPAIKIADLMLAEAQLEALHALALVFLREIKALKRTVIEKRSSRSDDPIDLEKEMTATEAGLIKWALMKTDGNQAAAARLLSIKPPTLHEKMKRYRIKATDRFVAVD